MLTIKSIEPDDLARRPHRSHFVRQYDEHGFAG
jgi:hypothetical protein